MRKWFVPIFIFCLLKGNAQTFTQWAQTVNWDGVSHWSKYMITQPAYQGPNSLPVPRIGNGSIDSNFSISATGNFHFSKGDNTQNLSLYANYCLVKDVISFDAAWVPYEHFTMSQAVKEKRHVFSQFFYDTDASGELHLNTNFQLLNKWKKYIRLAARVGYRFPTGSGFGAARYTDGPGYYFDLSFGKPFNRSAIKWVGMLGFYSWQVESEKHNQDDAFLFGTGLEWNKNNWRIQTNVAGYLGYLKNSGDKPVVCRFNMEKKIKTISLLLGFQQGLHDFGFTSAEFGVKYFFKAKEKQITKLPK
jgi:hypothetical protein